MALGLHYDPEALQDFDLDVTHHSVTEIKEDSLMGLAVHQKINNK